MKLNRLLRELKAAQGSNATAGEWPVVGIVDDAPEPYPFVELVEPNEDTVVLWLKTNPRTGMNLNGLIGELFAAEGSSETAGSRGVVAIVDDGQPPYPDAVIVEQSGHRIAIRFKTFTE